MAKLELRLINHSKLHVENGGNVLFELVCYGIEHFLRLAPICVLVSILSKSKIGRNDCSVHCIGREYNG